MTQVIVCRGASRRYAPPGGVPILAVDEVDLEVEAGDVVAIVGPSGSGKTTLLGLLAGLEPADAGTVTVLGHDVAHLSTAEKARLRRSRIGIVFQTFGLVSSLSAGENVALPMALDSVGGEERRGRAADALAEVGLGHAYEARIDELSGGERQRVGIARAIAAHPALILADEPTGSLDDENAGAVLDLLIGAAGSRGASLVLVTHDPTSAVRADHRFRMLDGQLKTDLD